MAVQNLTNAYAAGLDGIQAEGTGMLQVRTMLLASAGQEDGSLPVNDITGSKLAYQDSASASEPDVAKSSRMNKPLAHRSKQNKRSEVSIPPTVSGAVARADSRPSRKLVLLLSTTLSDTAQAMQPASPVSTNGAGEMESAAKERKLRELYAQIAATEKMIEARQRQLDIMEGRSDPGVAGSGLADMRSGDSNAAEVVSQQSKTKAATQDVQSASDDLLRQVRSLEIPPVDPTIVLAVISFSALAVFSYRKIKSMRYGQPEATDIREDGGYPGTIRH